MKARVLLALYAILIVPGLVLPQLAFGQTYSPKEATSLPSGSIASGQSNLKPEEAWPNPVDDMDTFTFFLSEILEYRTKNGDDEMTWDVFGWHGGDYNRLWIKSEGSASTRNSSGDGDFQLLYGRLISRYFDFQLGFRYEQLWNDEGSDHSRGFGVIGFQGLAPYYFDIEPTLFVSQDGDVSARFTATYDILLTQRLILQPRIEGNAAVQDNEKFSVGSGINNVEAGLRIRYEFKREFAPYIGINYGRRFGETADFARMDDEDTQDWSFVSGVRLWF